MTTALSASLLDDYMSQLLAGNRAACRNIIQARLAELNNATKIYEELLWPAMERVEKLYRCDRINIASEHMATRINRSIADQLQLSLPKNTPNGKRVVISCADGEPEELGAQMTADLMESQGWEVFFMGGGVPNDEILSLVGQLRPQLLLIYGTRPQGVPGVRLLVDMIREIGVNQTMNIMVSGGVFNRADSLWKEVNADLFAKTAAMAIPLAEAAKPREAVFPKPGAPKKRRRRRKPLLLIENEK